MPPDFEETGRRRRPPGNAPATGTNRRWNSPIQANRVPTLEALQLLLDLGAEPAAALVRRRLRALGVARIPRRRPIGSKANPAGLTDRQIEILRMLSTGISNAEIAQRLVVSPRTVDHHVSAILQKLGVRSRREAANRLATLDAADHGRSRCEPNLVDVLGQSRTGAPQPSYSWHVTPMCFSDLWPGWPLDCQTGPARPITMRSGRSSAPRTSSMSRSPDPSCSPAISPICLISKDIPGTAG